ncbi:MAG: septum formation initiator family protein [Acidimicrobiia bacterium]
MSTGHRTSSIPRPRRSGMMDRVRSAVPAGPRREVGDDTRLIQRKRNRNLLTLGAAVIVAALAAAVLVLPFRAWLNQRSELAERQHELAALDAANERIAQANERLQTPQGIEETARNDLGYLEAGEQQLTVLPAPSTGEQLPGRWPYTMVSDIFAVRAEADAVAAATAAASAATETAAPATQAPAAATEPATSTP